MHTCYDDNEDHMDPRDVNDHGVSIFDMIDRENTRFMGRKREINQAMEKEYFHHAQNLRAIWASFGVHYNTMPRAKPQKLSGKTKCNIKKRVLKWSLTDPASGCYSSRK